MKTKMHLLLLFAGLASLFAACSGPQQPVVAKVDGRPIYRNELIAAYTYYRPANIYKLATADSLRRKLQTLIDDQLILAEARKQQLDQDPKVAADLQLQKNMTFQRFVLDEVTLAKMYPDSILRKYYQNLQREVLVRHILLKLRQRADPEEEKLVLQRIRALQQELQKGKDFAELARKYSQDPYSKNRGGNIGFVKWAPYPYEDAAFALKKGEISEPFRGEAGYFLIQVIRERRIIVPPYSEAKHDILMMLRKADPKAFTAAVNQFVEQMQEKHATRLDEGNIAHVAMILSEFAQSEANRPNEPVTLETVFSDQELALELARVDDAVIFVRDIGNNLRALRSEKQLRNWLDFQVRNLLIRQEGLRLGLHKKPIFHKMAEKAAAAFLSNEIQKRVIQPRANERARQMEKKSLRSSDWERIVNQQRRAWLADLKQQFTVEIDDGEIAAILAEFKRRASGT